MEWTLEYASTTQSFAAWGLEGLEFNFAPFATGTATFSAKASAFDAATPFARGAAGIIRADGTVVFRGTFGPTARRGGGADSEMSFVLRDAWYDLERRFYLQSAVALPQFNEGIATLLESVIDHAASVGVAIQFGTAANLAITAPKLEFRDQTHAGMIKQLRRLVPDVAHYLDHTTSPPTIHFVRRADATAITLPTSDWDALDITSLEDIQTTGVRLRYTRLIASGSGTTLDVIEDVYPEGTTGGEDGAVVATFDLRGNQVETQPLEVTNIAATSRAWWSQFYAWIAPGNVDLDEGTSFAFTGTSRQTQDVSGNWVSDTGGHTNQITGGGVPSWESEAAQVLVSATLNDFTLDGEYHENFELKATVSATSLTGGLYVRETQAAETLPSGLAQAYYEATSVLHYDGSISGQWAELSLPLPHAANVFNLTGGSATARGWDTMRAVARSISIQVDSASMQVDFGPPEHLAPQDMLELARMAGQGRVIYEQNEPGVASGGGIRRAPNSNTLPPKPVEVGRHPFYIMQSTGELVIGSVNGSIIPTISGSEIGIGGASLTLSGSGYVYLKAMIDLTFHSTTNFLSSWAIQESGGDPVIAVVGSATPLTDGISGGVLTAYKLIAQIVDGVVQRPQPVSTVFNLNVCDQSDGTALGKNAVAVWTPA